MHKTEYRFNLLEKENQKLTLSFLSSSYYTTKTMPLQARPKVWDTSHQNLGRINCYTTSVLSNSQHKKNPHLLIFIFILIFTCFKMPRPGPRPYECMRRAWHSDRHQPIRGSVIRQIFRFFSSFSLMLYSFPRIRNRASPLRLGSPPSFTLRLLRATRSGRRSSPSLYSELKKSSTPKPIPRFFSLFQPNACRTFLDLFVYFSFHLLRQSTSTPPRSSTASTMPLTLSFAENKPRRPVSFCHHVSKVLQILFSSHFHISLQNFQNLLLSFRNYKMRAFFFFFC